MLLETHLVTFEWRRIRPGTVNEWRRENEPIEGCPGLWWARYCQRCAEIYKAQAERYDQSRKDCDEPILEERRFLYATPITREGYSMLKLKYGPSPDL